MKSIDVAALGKSQNSLQAKGQKDLTTLADTCPSNMNFLQSDLL